MQSESLGTLTKIYEQSKNVESNKIDDQSKDVDLTKIDSRSESI